VPSVPGGGATTFTFDPGAGVTGGQALVGIAEKAYAGVHNQVVRIAGGLASIPVALISGVDSAVNMQKAMQESYGYNATSTGAQAIDIALQPMAQRINTVIQEQRGLSEKYYGDGFATVLFSGVEAGLEIAGTVGGIRGAQGMFNAGVNLAARSSLTTAMGDLAGANTDIAAQAGGKSSLRFERTEGLGTHASMAELRTSGALPGEQGIIITDRAVRFGDVYELGVLNGRRMEFSLVTEHVDGQLVKKLYSGDAWVSPVPRDSRLLGHVHPNETASQMWPSSQDMSMVNARYFRELMVNPNAAPAPTRIFWGPGNSDNTIFYPGFGKTPTNH
jgi:hypothetical protein